MEPIRQCPSDAIPMASSRWYARCLKLSFLGLALVGIMVDILPAPKTWQLLFAFYGAALGGLLIGLWPAWATTPNRRARVGMVLLAGVVWRVAYFPIFVLAGWFATWSDWLFFELDAAYAPVYPFFLVAIAGLHAIAVRTAVTIYCQRRWSLLLLAMPPFLLAILVSFNHIEDLSLLPDRTVERPELVATPLRPPRHVNIYAQLLQSQDYNFAQRTLVHAGRILYPLIPSAPWSYTARDVIAEGIQRNPVASSADRIGEHYIAYLVAHPCILRTTQCRGLRSVKR